MIKKLLSSTMLLLLVSRAAAGGLSQTSVVSADTTPSITQNDILKNKEINLIKNGDFSESGKYWLLNGMYTPDFSNGYATVSSISGPLSNAEDFNVEPNTKYKLGFDIKSDGVWTSQSVVELVSDESELLFEKSITSPKEWTTFSYDYTTPAHINKLHFSIFEQRESAFLMDNVKFEKIGK